MATIALDEARHVDRWAASAADADLLVIGDTGSTDGTPDLARAAGACVHDLAVRPWRFDDARNALLALIPADIDWVITLDMDEVLAPGWRAAVAEHPHAQRLSYEYVWSWTPDGAPDITFRGDRCHRRAGYRWAHPVHETLVRSDGRPDQIRAAGFAVHHHPDPGKPRHQYLPLLALAAAEAPTDDRMAHYHARELFFAGRWDDARAEFVRHLQLPSATWPAERAESYRYLAAMDTWPERWLWQAVAQDPARRPAWVDLADLYLSQGRTADAAAAAARALALPPVTDYMAAARINDDTRLAAIAAST